MAKFLLNLTLITFIFNAPPPTWAESNKQCVSLFKIEAEKESKKASQNESKCPFLNATRGMKKWFSSLPFFKENPGKTYLPSYSTDYEMLKKFFFGRQPFPQRNMSRIDAAEQFIIDKQYAEQVGMRQKMYSHPAMSKYMSLSADQPGVKEAMLELRDLLAIELPQYHPTVFERKENILVNKVTSEKIDLSQKSDPLGQIGQHIQEDLILMKPMDEASSDHQLVAGFLASPTVWSLKTWLGGSITKIHEGVSSEAKSADLIKTINGLLRVLKNDHIVARNNWHITSDPSYSQADYRTTSFKEPRITRKNVGENLFVRIERQTMRKLPVSKFSVFTIKIYTYRLKDLTQFPDVVEDLYKGLVRYKAEEGAPFTPYHKMVLEFLEPHRPVKTTSNQQ